MSSYDDLLGLDMFDDMGDMDAILTPRQVLEMLTAAGVATGSIMLAGWGLPKVPVHPMLGGSDPKKASRVRALIAGAAGLVAGRLLWDQNRDLAMAVIGGVGGLGFAQLLNSFFTTPITSIGTPLGLLPEDMALSAGDEALLAAYDMDSSQALAALEAANMNTSRGAFSDPTVTHEALMGAVVQQAELGYNPYMA